MDVALAKLEFVGIKEFEKRVLEDFGEHCDILELGFRKTANHCVGNVANAGLKRKEVLRKTALFNFVFQELDKMTGDLFGFVVCGCIAACLVRTVAFNNSNDLVCINRNCRGADSILFMIR